jgi:hypothetical protein
MKVQSFRDLTLVHLSADDLLVVACDSCGGVGSKAHDQVQTSPHMVGYYTTYVALAELIAFGAEPVCIINTLSVEMNPTGKEIIAGIRQAIEPLGAPPLITGSTEENFSACQTGMGITVIGSVHLSSWQRPRSHPGDLVVVVGLPKVGEQVIADQGRTTLDLEKLLLLKGCPFIHEVLPVGSRGIAYELTQLAQCSGLQYRMAEHLSIDVTKTAGPATCALVTLRPVAYEQLAMRMSIPVNPVGWLV